jgi:hypothetical protein
MKKEKHDKKHERKHKGSPALTVRSPDICVDNFSANNNDTVSFKNIPAAGVTLTQISGNTFPFVKTGTNSNGLLYTNVAQGGSATIAVPAINQTYPYAVSCTCPGLSGNHSVTVS